MHLADLAVDGARYFDTAQDLRDCRDYGEFPKQAVTRGALVAGDGGHGPWRWDAASTADDDLATVLQLTGHVGAGRYLREFSSPINVLWLGAKRDGTDNGDTLHRAIAIAIRLGTDDFISTGPIRLVPAVYVPAGVYLVDPNLLDAALLDADKNCLSLTIYGDNKHSSILVLNADGYFADLAGSPPKTLQQLVLKDIQFRGDLRNEEPTDGTYPVAAGRNFMRSMPGSNAIQGWTLDRVHFSRFFEVWSPGADNNDAEFDLKSCVVSKCQHYWRGKRRQQQIYNWSHHACSFFIYGELVSNDERIGGYISFDQCNIIMYSTTDYLLRCSANGSASGSPNVSFDRSRIEFRKGYMRIFDGSAAEGGFRVLFKDSSLYEVSASAGACSVFRVNLGTEVLLNRVTIPNWHSDRTIQVGLTSMARAQPGRVVFDGCIGGPVWSDVTTSGSGTRAPLVAVINYSDPVGTAFEGIARNWTWKGAHAGTRTNALTHSDDYHSGYLHRVAFGRSLPVRQSDPASLTLIELPVDAFIKRVVFCIPAQAGGAATTQTYALQDGNGTVLWTQPSPTQQDAGVYFEITSEDLGANAIASGTALDRSLALVVGAGGAGNEVPGYSFIEYF
jgi:hypothetical protein